MGRDTFFKEIFVFEILGATPVLSSNKPVFTQYFTNCPNVNLPDAIWKKYHAPLVAPGDSYG